MSTSPTSHPGRNCQGFHGQRPRASVSGRMIPNDNRCLLRHLLPLDPPDIAILMVPLPAQGHLNQLLQLSFRISSSYPDIPIHFASSATHNHQARLRSTLSVATTNIIFHDLVSPPFPSPPPNPNSSHKFPSHLLPAFRHANEHLCGPISDLICYLSSSIRRLVVINDSLMASSIQRAFSLPNAESYTFHSVSAFTIHWFLNGSSVDDKEELLRCFPPEFLEFARAHYEFKKLSSGNIFNTCRVVEGAYMDMLELQSHRKHWALGPFNPVMTHRPFGRCQCIEWLGMQEPNSVLYVSFGTTTAFSDQQVRELAIGLENSTHKFIWVLREADRGDIFGKGEVREMVLPKGYEERIERRGLGLVVREWAPQMEILGHRSTGGFMSHCGWNSCMESISMGVPVAAWPIHSDQIKNAELLTNVLGVGILVRKNKKERDNVVGADTVEGAVRELMGSKEGAEARKRAEDIGINIRKSTEEVGIGASSPLTEMDSFVAHILRN
ncbi:hypothetical protein MLD38_007586 [Melastoma candidum]|uniref:Uncharacterized protein n=1 Tax=Melastoma candidum TaxID=119954 RepID=A0ACB9RTH0_9MYRT|nr:hypothetical protein MLD38_007586 [Melastoma candidum]